MRNLALLTILLTCLAPSVPGNALEGTSLTSDTGIYVVLGSFSSIGAARNQAELLSLKFNELIRIAGVNTGSRSYFRLLAGPYPQHSAGEKRSQFRNQGVPDAWFVYTGPDFLDQPDSAGAAAVTSSSVVTEAQVDSEPKPYAPVRAPLNEHGPQSRSDISVRGYLKSYAIAQRGIDIKGAPNGLVDDRSIYQSQNSLRIIVEGEPSDKAVWQLHYELTPVFFSSDIGNPLFDTTFTSSENSYRVTDIDQVLGTDSGKSVVYQNLDRLNLQLKLEPGDLTIGRQAIAFGSARVINPTDVFLPFDVQTLNQEYRIGIDAIRFQQPLGELGEVDMGMILGQDAKQENSAAYVQVVNNYSGVDLHWIAMRFADHNLAGFGVQTSLGEMGYWFEMAQVWNGAEYFRLSTGLDYAFSENIYGLIEYHYNGAGSRASSSYAEQLGDFAYQKGGVFLLGQNYLIPSISWTVSPLLSVSLQSISNLDDSSSFISLSGEYSISENLYGNFGLYYFYGDELKFTPTPPYLQISSEYGINSDLVYLALRYYF